MQAAIYLRQSEDRNGDMLAIDRQREDCAKLCAQRGWATVEYVDNDTSASSGKTATGLPADARRHPRRAASTRWWPGTSTGCTAAPSSSKHFIDLADQKHLALATVGGDADLSTDDGRLFARIKGAVARSEVERKSARQKRANQQRAERRHAQPVHRAVRLPQGRRWPPGARTRRGDAGPRRLLARSWRAAACTPSPRRGTPVTCRRGAAMRGPAPPCGSC